MNTEQILNLLNQVSAIIKRYEDIAERTGENFNIFKVLKVTSSEVRTHSAFMAELLNPKGSHGQKDVFLKLFVEQINFKDFDCESATIKVEKYIGFIADDGREGGFLDIFITDKNKKAIIIENKIYAEDQSNQLLRYYNYGRKHHENEFVLLYLTLDGKEPIDTSKADLRKSNWTNISYAEFVMKWLNNCKEKAVNHPILRESITQYINLIRFLTGIAINDDMENEIKNLVLSNPTLLKTIPLLTSVEQSIRNETKDHLLYELNSSDAIDVKVEIGPLEILIEFVNDSDGFQLCFNCKEGGELVNVPDLIDRLPILNENRNLLEGKFEITGSPLCWIVFENFRPKIQLQNMPIEELVKVANPQGEGRRMFSESIIEEARGYIADFKEIINNS